MMTEDIPAAREEGTAEASVAQRVADAVLAVPGVTGLHGGLFGEVATYLPGGRVSGVALGDDEGEVHIVVDVTYDLRSVAAAARAAGEAISGYPLNVTVEDISTGAAGAEPQAAEERGEDR